MKALFKKKKDAVMKSLHLLRKTVSTVIFLTGQNYKEIINANPL